MLKSGLHGEAPVKWTAYLPQAGTRGLWALLVAYGLEGLFGGGDGGGYFLFAVGGA